MTIILYFVDCGAPQTYCHRRLKMLEDQFNIHMSLNWQTELKELRVWGHPSLPQNSLVEKSYLAFVDLLPVMIFFSAVNGPGGGRQRFLQCHQSGQPHSSGLHHEPKPPVEIHSTQMSRRKRRLSSCGFCKSLACDVIMLLVWTLLCGLPTGCGSQG